jgi:hypothetical protein
MALAMVMKAPIWYLLAKVDFIGGHAWGRGYLVEQFVQHFSDWWLVGTDQNAGWGDGLWDRCNGYVAEAGSGGLLSLGLLIALISRGFGIAGRFRKRSSGNQAWLAWCVGSTLFAHVIELQGISYWDQMSVPWFLFLAMFPCLDRMTALCRAASRAEAPSAEVAEVGSPGGRGRGECSAQPMLI